MNSELDPYINQRLSLLGEELDQETLDGLVSTCASDLIKYSEGEQAGNLIADIDEVIKSRSASLSNCKLGKYLFITAASIFAVSGIINLNQGEIDLAIYALSSASWLSGSSVVCHRFAKLYDGATNFASSVRNYVKGKLE